jgi:hypothetical protein
MVMCPVIWGLAAGTTSNSTTVSTVARYRGRFLSRPQRRKVRRGSDLSHATCLDGGDQPAGGIGGDLRGKLAEGLVAPFNSSDDPFPEVGGVGADGRTSSRRFLPRVLYPVCNTRVNRTSRPTRALAGMRTPRTGRARRDAARSARYSVSPALHTLTRCISAGEVARRAVRLSVGGASAFRPGRRATRGSVLTAGGT